jgi:hypothetical protein
MLPPNYAIRYFKRDGAPTLTYFVECLSDESAIAHMRTMLGIECDRAEVWRDDQLIHVERKSRPVLQPLKT